METNQAAAEETAANTPESGGVDSSTQEDSQANAEPGNGQGGSRRRQGSGGRPQGPLLQVQRRSRRRLRIGRANGKAERSLQ